MEAEFEYLDLSRLSTLLWFLERQSSEMRHKTYNFLIEWLNTKHGVSSEILLEASL